MPADPQSHIDAAVAALPAALRASLQNDWQEFARQAAALYARHPQAAFWSSLPAVWAASEFVTRSCLQHPAVLAELLDSGDLLRAYGPQELRTRVRAAAQAAGDEAALKQALRLLRRREMVRIAWRDLAGWADLDEVLATLSEFAEACIDAALSALLAWATLRDGQPRAADGAPAHLVVLGMGKLGGGELNFSSDIDLIFAYTADGEADGARALSNHEFFIRLGRALIAALNDSTGDGFVFRVDMRLRPNGDSGPLALSFDAMEQYYQLHGREWERYAFIKARAVAGDAASGAQLLARLRPFVYRKYIDFGAVEAIRGLKVAIERELQRKGLAQNIKLGPGGIREIEFIGQAFQLIRGGRERALQVRPILQVLAVLGVEGHLTPTAVTELQQAYAFLRRSENRLQMAADRQTHHLPTEAPARLALAYAMGYPDWEGYALQLVRHMRKVHGHFEQVFAAPQGEAAGADDRGLASAWAGGLEPGALHARLQAVGFQDPAAAGDLIRGLRQGGVYVALSAQGRERMDRLMPLLLGAAGLTPDPNTTLVRLVKLIEAIGRRSVYLSLLVENPLALSQLVKLCSVSEWIAGWISQHPILLDELMDPASLYAPLARADLEAELQRRLVSLPVDDLEAQMEALREFRHTHVLRVAAADVYRSTQQGASSGLSPEETAVHLGHIAEVVVCESLALATHSMVAKHGRPTCLGTPGPEVPGFAVIAYGKLGSLELGYSSDLDMIFLHGTCPGEGVTDGARPVANEVFFARLGQRLIHVLTTRTPAGILYPVDMRLRPSGQSGTLVTHLPAFLDYQREHAWTWEHQALVRARALAGDPVLCQGFEAARRELLCRVRDPVALRRDVLDMRARMRAAHAAHDPTRMDLKQDPGGMIDIEFMVQYWVLWRAHEHPELTRHRDNIHILEALAGAGLLDAGTMQTLVGAYRRYLSVEHRFKLMERQALVAPDELGDHPARVAAIWARTFKDSV